MSTYEQLLRLPEARDENRVILIDGHSLAYRSYYAIRDLTTRAGAPINAVFGFWRALLKTMRDHPSAYVAVAFDAGGKTFRHELSPDYKATRKPMPEDLAIQLPVIERLLAALGISVFSERGIEADDLLATIASRAAEQGFRCLILTSDKDLAQLVDDHIAILRPSGRGRTSEDQVLDPSGVSAKYGVPPERIVDWLSLVGDTSDNVPGVPGVGEKTAGKLLSEYGSLDAILESADSVRNARVRENLKTHADAARLARRMISLMTDLPLANPVERCRLQGIDRVALADVFRELEFTTALSELGLDELEPGEEPASPQDTRVPEYHTVLTEEVLDRVVRDLAGAETLSIDLETTGLDPMTADIVGIAVSGAPYVGYYIPVGHDALGAPEQLPLSRVLEVLRPLIEADEPRLIGQNIKYDLKILERNGLSPHGISFDAMIAFHLLHPDEPRHGLDQIASAILGVRMTPYEEVAGKDGAFASVPVDAATAYAAEDAEIVQRVREPLLKGLDSCDATELFETVEMPLVPVLARMERHGILLDRSILTEQENELRKELEIIQADLFEMAGETFNPNSPKQVAEILFSRLGLPVVDRTKTGPSTSARVLAQLAVLHPLPGKLMAYRELTKLLSTYIEQLPRAVHPQTGRIHTTFRQAVTATGRLSSSDPNLQNIPTRTEMGGRIRQAFVAPDRHVLISADYSQIELRLLAHFSQDRLLLEAFQQGMDLHRLTASHVFGVDEHRVTDTQRQTAKRINFGILYGISPYGLARDLGTTQSEAKEYIERFFSAYPEAKAYLAEMVDVATRNGYAQTLLGRRRPLRHLTARNAAQRNFDRRNAVNTPIQGSAADLIKLAMIEIDWDIEGGRLPAKMLLQIHDELIFEATASSAEDVSSTVRERMEGVMPLRVPLAVKVHIGSNWGEI